MAKNSNISEEIQELVRQIKTKYQEGVDFEIPYCGKVGDEKREYGAMKCLSPRLREFCRKKFNIPSGVNDYLDYHKRDQLGDNYYYRVRDSKHEGLYWQSNKNKIEQEEPKKCQVCGEMTFEENGRFWLWNEKTVGKGFGENSKVAAYFHPRCAKEYFANKEPVSEIKARLQKNEKILLRNLDKICIDPEGYLANIEYLKTDVAEEEYYQMFSVNSRGGKNRFLKITIDGEEVNLEDFDNTDRYFEVKRELIKKIKQEIKQNPSEWKIEKGKNERRREEDNWVVKHQSGRRHWKFGISHMRGKDEWKIEGQKDWAEIEALLTGSEIPVDNNQVNDSDEQEKKIILQYFLNNSIKSVKISSGGSELIIEYKSGEKKTILANSQELFCLQHFIQNKPNKSLSLTELQNNTNSATPNSNNHNLAIGLVIGGVILVGIIIIYLLTHKKKKIN